MLGLDIFEMTMPQLGKKRTVRVWVPSDYTDLTHKRYPVIYMHDGQNLFDRATSGYGEIWDVHSAIEMLMETKGISGAIVVGVDNAEGTSRLDEYSPWESDRVEELKGITDVDRPIGGDGEKYGAFLVETLKPYIDMHYRTLTDREHTCVAGSSMGGFISLYIGVRYPNVFSKVGAFSTAAWFAQSALLSFIEKMDTAPPIKWYLDIGTNETSNAELTHFNEIYLNGTMAIEKSLLSCGVPREDVRMVIDEGAIHNEVEWARRLPAAIEWLFNW